MRHPWGRKAPTWSLDGPGDERGMSSSPNHQAGCPGGNQSSGLFACPLCLPLPSDLWHHLLTLPHSLEAEEYRLCIKEKVVLRVQEARGYALPNLGFIIHPYSHLQEPLCRSAQLYIT